MEKQNNEIADATSRGGIDLPSKSAGAPYEDNSNPASRGGPDVPTKSAGVPYEDKTDSASRGGLDSFSKGETKISGEGA